MLTKQQAEENINKRCKERLAEIYPAGIPDFARERFECEFEAMQNSETALRFEVYRRICESAARMPAPIITSNGTFLAYLLGFMGINPLPAHYYCPVCGNWECSGNYGISGFDLPEKSCSCGNGFDSMGIGIPFECVWGEKRSKKVQNLTIRSASALLPFAKKAVEDIFGADRVYPYGIKMKKSDGSPDIYLTFGGLTVLPENVERKDIEEEICWLEDGEECLDGTYIYSNDFFYFSVTPNPLLDVLFECQNRTGIFAADIPLKEFAEIGYKGLLSLGAAFGEQEAVQRLKPSSKGEISRILSACHSTVDEINYKNNSGEEIEKFFSDELFKKYPFIEREDFIIYLIENGVLSEDAVSANIFFRKGRTSEAKFKEILDRYGFPEDFYEAVYRYKYLFPRYHNSAFLYIYLLLVKYSRYDRRGYLAVLNKYYKTK